MKKLYMFDLDGTLIDPHTAITKGIQFALSHIGIHVDDRNELNCFIGPPIRDSLREFYQIDDPATVEPLVEKYLEYFAKNGIYENSLYSGVLTMLETLQATDCILTIATSKLMTNAIKIAKHLQFSHYFEQIIGSELGGGRSQKVEVISHLLSLTDPKNEHLAIMIGDRKYDIIGAKKAEQALNRRIISIGCTWGYAAPNELKTENPDFIANNIAELTTHLTTLS